MTANCIQMKNRCSFKCLDVIKPLEGDIVEKLEFLLASLKSV